MCIRDRHILDLNFLNQKETIASFLIEDVNGPILIETGPYSNHENLKKAIKKVGYEIEEIKKVFVTHVHFDHAGGAWAFAKHGATIYTHPSGTKHLRSPEKLYNSAKRIYKDQMESLWGIMEPIPTKQVVGVKHKEIIKVGKTKIRGLHTPGHANHHIAWEIKKTLFSGDVAGVKIGENIVMPPCPPPDIDVEKWSKSIKLMLEKRYDNIYLTHFGEVTNVKPHLVELRGRIKNWANWIKPYYQDNIAQEKVIPIFEQYVKKQLEMGGATPATIKKYEAANPAFMSVAGLYRYWQKKEEKAKDPALLKIND